MTLKFKRIITLYYITFIIYFVLYHNENNIKFQYSNTYSYEYIKSLDYFRISR